MNIIFLMLSLPVITVASLFNIPTVQAPTEPMTVELPQEAEDPLIRTNTSHKKIVKQPTKPPILVAENKISTKSITSRDEIIKIINKHFGKYASQAIKIATCESGLNPSAKGDVGIQYYQDGILYGASYGIFQVRYLPGRPTPDKLVDPEFNIKYAADLHSWHGWSPWFNCSKKNGLL